MTTNASVPFVVRLLGAAFAATALAGVDPASPRSVADATPPAGQEAGGDRPAATGNGKDSDKSKDKREKDRDGGADGLLSGPKVGDNEAQDDKAFGRDGGRGKGGRVDGPRRPMAEARLWMDALRSLELQGDQKTRVDAVLGKFEQARKEFEKEHGDQRRALEKKLRELGGGADGGRGAGSPAGPGAESAEGKALRRQMQELAAKAPKPEPFQKEIFALLTPDQQGAFKAKLEELAAQRATMREAREKRGDEMGGDGPRRGPTKPRDAGGAHDDPMKGAAGGESPKKPRQDASKGDSAD